MVTGTDNIHLRTYINVALEYFINENMSGNRARIKVKKIRRIYGRGMRRWLRFEADARCMMGKLISSLVDDEIGGLERVTFFKEMLMGHFGSFRVRDGLFGRSIFEVG